MTRANTKRFKRGDPLVYKGHILNNKNIMFYIIGNEIIVYKSNNDKTLIESNRTTIVKFKKYYLKAVRKARKENPGISHYDNRIFKIMIEDEFKDRINKKIKGDK
jgi:hypothetical protein